MRILKAIVVENDIDVIKLFRQFESENSVLFSIIKIVSDSSGFEGYVTKNNSKFFEFLLKTSENYAKSGRVNDIFVIFVFFFSSLEPFFAIFSYHREEAKHTKYYYKKPFRDNYGIP
jgi:hypothetical protein